MTEARPPDYMAAIAGARAWRMAPNLWAKLGGHLWSHALLHCWEDGKELVAKCDLGHPAPAKGCMCGVWAWKDVDLLHNQGYAPHDHQYIAGVIAGRGRVIRSGHGYWVAERVVVCAFFDDGHPSPVVEVLPGEYLPTKESAAAAFDVPVIRYEDYNDFCDELGLIRF